MRRMYLSCTSGNGWCKGGRGGYMAPHLSLNGVAPHKCKKWVGVPPELHAHLELVFIMVCGWWHGMWDVAGGVLVVAEGSGWADEVAGAGGNSGWHLRYKG